MTQVDVTKVELYALGWFAPGRDAILDTLADLVVSVRGVAATEIWAGPPDRRVPKGRAGRVGALDGLERVTARLDLDDHGSEVGGVEAVVDPDADRDEVARVVAHVAQHLQALIGRWRVRGRELGLAVVDSDATLLWANDELSRIMGWSVAEAVGTNVLTYLHPDDLVAAAGSFERTARFPGPKVPYDLRFRTADGSWLQLETVAENRLDDPTVGGIVFSFRDPRNRHPADRLVTTETEVLTAIAADVAWTKVFDLVVGLLDDRIPAAAWSVWGPVDGATPATARLLVRIADTDAPGDATDGPGQAEPVVAVAPSGSTTGAAFHRRQAVIAADVERDDLVDPATRADLLAAGIGSVWSVPVLDPDGAPGAVLEGRLRGVGHPSTDQSRVLDLAANLIALALERDRSVNAREHAASHDPMTGLLNRHAFGGLLESHVEVTEPGRLSVLVIDLDGFKTINDSLGHAAGDVLLRAVANRIRACGDSCPGVRGLARFGGDEFMVLVDGPDAARGLADDVLDALAAPFRIDGYDLHIGASIGLAVHDRVLSPSASDLLSNADAAMDVAKHTRPRRTVEFDRDIATRVDARLTTTTGLRRAVEAEEFVVHYQAIVDLRTSSPVAAEALVRWHEGDIVHPPAVFLEVAEDTGLIVPIGRLVLGHAARRTARRAQTTFVNLSAHQLLDEGLHGLIDAALTQAGVDPEQIGFEITEHAVIPDPAAAIEVLTRLRDQGHPLSIDDFGTGYASLAYLRDLPVDSVKIDRSFTARMHDDERTCTILAATIELAHDLDLTVVAEGIETERDADALTALGCDHGQGWYFHRPEPDA